MPPVPITFVLVEPRQPGNVGACCRALKNNGFRGLRLVRPPPLDGEARRMAWKSLDVLNAARSYDTLDAAIADAGLVAAFTARPRRDLREIMVLEDAVPRLLAAAAGGRVALLFGREDRGLTREEMAPAAFLVNIPAARARQVYNLSQAVLLAAYALRQAHVRQVEPAFQTTPRASPALTAGDRAHLVLRLRDALVTLGYDAHPDPGLLERILGRTARLLERAGPDRSDQSMLLGVVAQLERRLRER